MTRTTLDTGNNEVSLQLEHGPLVDAATGGPVTNATTSVRHSLLEVWLATGSRWFYDSTNSLQVGGTAVASATWTNYNINMAANKTLKVQALTTRAVPCVFGGVSNATVNVVLNGIGYSGDMSGAIITTVPRRPYQLPDRPTVTIDGSGWRASGHQLNKSLDKYWGNTDWMVETNDVWGAVSSFGGSQTSRPGAWPANSRIRGAVRARNQDATGGWGNSSYWYTEPAAVGSITIKRVNGNPKLEWVNLARYSHRIYIRRKVNGGAWESVATLPGSSTTYTDSAVGSADSVQYEFTTVTPTAVNTGTSTKAFSPVLAPAVAAPKAATSVTLTVPGNTSGTARIKLPQFSGGDNWTQMDWELLTDSTWSATTTTSVTTALQITGLSADHRYAVRVRGRNSAGESLWKTSPYVYTDPAPPTNPDSTASPDGTIELDLGGSSEWTHLVRVERSTNRGASWTVLTDFAPHETVFDTAGSATRIYYRFRAQTPAPIRYSDYTDPIVAFGPSAADKSKIPGVNRMYVGASRVQEVTLGTSSIWIDGEA